MIRYLRDPANAITVAGIAVSVIAISVASAGATNRAVALALWALLADHLDGAVAVRTRNRAPVMSGVGKNLDALADLVSAGIFPAVLLITLANHDRWSILAAIILVGASALRLSVFNTLGPDGDHFVGVPTSWVLPAVAALFLLRAAIPVALFVYFLGTLLLLLAALEVSALRTPHTRGWGYAAITLYCVGTSIQLATGPIP